MKHKKSSKVVNNNYQLFYKLLNPSGFATPVQKSYPAEVLQLSVKAKTTKLAVNKLKQKYTNKLLATKVHIVAIRENNNKQFRSV